MNKLLPKFFAQPSAKLLAVFIVVFTIGIVSLFLHDRQRNLTNLYVMEKQLSATRQGLLGRTQLQSLGVSTWITRLVNLAGRTV